MLSEHLHIGYASKFRPCIPDRADIFRAHFAKALSMRAAVGKQLLDERCDQRLSSVMRPADIQHVGNELAVKWDDGGESFIPLEKLRRSCPCAGCKGEVDILGNLHIGPAVALPPTAFELVRFTTIGTYAIQPVWADGHASGLFSFDYLRKVAEAKVD